MIRLLLLAGLVAMLLPVFGCSREEEAVTEPSAAVLPGEKAQRPEK